MTKSISISLPKTSIKAGRRTGGGPSVGEVNPLSVATAVARAAAKAAPAPGAKGSKMLQTRDSTHTVAQAKGRDKAMAAFLGIDKKPAKRQRVARKQ